MSSSELLRWFLLGATFVALPTNVQSADDGAPLPPLPSQRTLPQMRTPAYRVPRTRVPEPSRQIRKPLVDRVTVTAEPQPAVIESTGEEPQPCTSDEAVRVQGSSSHVDGAEDAACHGTTLGGRFALWRARTQMHWAETKACLQASHWGYPEYFEERPFGTLVDAHMAKQVANGIAARLVLYRYDFHEGILGDVTTLNPHGERRLHRIAQLMKCCPRCPLIIEPSGGRPDIDEARRQHVVERLANMNEPISDQMVLVRTPGMAGLRGEEAIEISDNLMHQTRMGGGGAIIAPSFNSGIVVPGEY